VFVVGPRALRREETATRRPVAAANAANAAETTLEEEFARLQGGAGALFLFVFF
jgi:hypothetical protein